MFHWVELRTFCHATEERERVEQALRFAGGGEIQATAVEGHHGNPILLLGSRLDTAKEMATFWEHAAVRENAAVWLETLEERMDDDATFHARLDKQAAYQERIVLATGTDVIDVTARVRVYPAKREKALAVLRQELERRCT